MPSGEDPKTILMSSFEEIAAIDRMERRPQTDPFLLAASKEPSIGSRIVMTIPEIELLVSRRAS